MCTSFGNGTVSELYDLSVDIGEQSNVASHYPGVINRLTLLANEKRKELGDSLTDNEGIAVRPPARFEN